MPKPAPRSKGRTTRPGSTKARPGSQTKARTASRTTSRTPKKNQPVVRSFTTSRWWPSSIQMKVLLLVVVLAFGTLGVMKLRDSNAATYNLSRANCIMLGRVYQSSGLCESKCVSGAGSYITSNVTWAYCTNALSRGISPSSCSNLRRTYVVGEGCARRWTRYNMTSQLQCRAVSDRYIVIPNGTDYCVAVGTANFNNSSNNKTGLNTGGSSATPTPPKPPTTPTPPTPPKTPTPPPATNAWYWPVPSVHHTGSISYLENGHKGIDIGLNGGAALGRTVVAAHAGTVSDVQLGGDCGSIVMIRTAGSTLYQGYQHLGSVSVKNGQHVNGNQAIGTVGKTGATTCTRGAWNTFYHLHFSIETRNQVSSYSGPNYSKNPCSYLPKCY